MKLSIKALTFVLVTILVVAFSSDAMAQRGRGGSGLGLGPGGGIGGGIPGSVECINAGPATSFCPYYGTGIGYVHGYGFKADTMRGQKATGSNRGFQGRGYGRGNAWR